MPGLRGTPAGIKTISEPLSASARADGVASYPWTFSGSVAAASAEPTMVSYLALGVDVANVGSDTCRFCELSIDDTGDGRKRTGSKTDIVESELADPRVELQ